AQIIMDRRARPLALLGLGLAEGGEPSVVRAQPPRRAHGHGLAASIGLISQIPVAELRIVLMRIEQRVGPIRLGQFGIGDRTAQPAVVGLAGELEHPARHRYGNPVGGELSYERVEPFDGRFACDRYAAARRTSSFSCSNSRVRRRSSRSSADSSVVVPGWLPASISACRIHFVTVLSWTPKSAAIWAIVVFSSRFRATRTTSSEFLRIGLGHDDYILPGLPESKPDQMSPIRASVPKSG